MIFGHVVKSFSPINGGGYYSEPLFAEIAYRLNYTSDIRSFILGLRLMRRCL